MGISNDNIHNPHTVNPGATYGQRGPPGPGFKLTSDGNYDIVAMTGDLNVGGHKITNLATPTTQTGGTTKKYVDDGLNLKVAQSQVMTGDAEAGKLVKYLPDKGIITPKLYVPDQYNDSVILEAEEQDYDDVHLKIPNLKNYDGREGRRMSSIVVDSLDNTLTSKLILPSGNLVIKDGNNQIVINRGDINKIYGSQSGSNGIISEKVALYRSSGEILANNFGTKVGNNVIFIRRRNQSGWRSLYIPSLSSDATLILDQTNQTINGDKTFSKAITMSEEGSANNHLVTKGYVDGHSTNSNYLKVDGSVAMSGDLNIGNHKITNTVAPTADGDIATKQYVDESHITPSEHFRENAFRYLMEDADESSSENNISVTGIAPFDASIHQNDKNAYRITLIKDLGSNDYRSRIGFNLGSLPIGYYTFVCEFFPIVMSNVSVTALGTTISINSQTTKTFPTYAKTIVQFHRWNSTPPQFIYLDLHGSETSNARNILAHMVVYGVKGYFPNVPSSVFDQIYVVNNGHMVMQTDLDLNGHRLVNGNLEYTINGGFDRDHNTELNHSKYFTFDKISYFIFMTPCTIKDYLFAAEEVDVKGVYDSHDIVFIKNQFNIKNYTTPSKISELLKSHPSGRVYSYGILNINMPKASVLQIAIGKNYNGSRFDKASIRYANIALSIAM